jgi:transcriptional regulator with XRE-family HTH domain
MRREPGRRQNGAAIRALRVKDRRSARDLAEHVGIHEQALRNIENNTRPASPEVMRRIADILNVPVAAITRDGETADEAEPAGAAA